MRPPSQPAPHPSTRPLAHLEMLARMLCDFTVWSFKVFFASDNGAHSEGGHDHRFFDSTGGLRGYKRRRFRASVSLQCLLEKGFSLVWSRAAWVLVQEYVRRRRAFPNHGTLARRCFGEISVQLRHAATDMWRRLLQLQASLLVVYQIFRGPFGTCCPQSQRLPGQAFPMAWTGSASCPS